VNSVLADQRSCADGPQWIRVHSGRGFYAMHYADGPMALYQEHMYVITETACSGCCGKHKRAGLLLRARWESSDDAGGIDRLGIRECMTTAAYARPHSASVLGSCRTRRLVIIDSIGSLLTCPPCSISALWLVTGGGRTNCSRRLHLVALSVMRAAIGSSDGQGG
jgi:hypothetical protein